MIVIPELPIRGGACPQGGRSVDRALTTDPAGAATAMLAVGFSRLHVLDLDGLAGRAPNMRALESILSLSEAAIQAQGYTRGEEDFDRLLDDGAERVVIGPREAADVSVLAELTASWPGELIFACDVRERRVQAQGVRGWMPVLLEDLLEELEPLPLAAVIVTALDRQGQLQGPDLALMEDAAEGSAHPILARGGVSTLNDLRALESRGLSGAIVGSALYAGVLDLRRAAEEFDSTAKLLG